MRLFTDGNRAAAWTGRCVCINSHRHRAITATRRRADARPVKGFRDRPIGVRCYSDVVAFARAHSCFRDWINRHKCSRAILA